MITVTYGATFSLDDALKPFQELYYIQPGEPNWYWNQRTNIIHRMEEDLEDDIDKCDKRIDKVVFDHMCWASCSFATEDTSLIRFEAEELQRKIQKCIDDMVAEYPSRLKKFHEDLLSDGEEIPVDVYRP